MKGRAANPLFQIQQTHWYEHKPIDSSVNLLQQTLIPSITIE
jgi:hypothetical protein